MQSYRVSNQALRMPLVPPVRDFSVPLPGLREFRITRRCPSRVNVVPPNALAAALPCVVSVNSRHVVSTSLDSKPVTTCRHSKYVVVPESVEAILAYVGVKMKDADYYVCAAMGQFVVGGDA